MSVEIEAFIIFTGVFEGLASESRAAGNNAAKNIWHHSCNAGQYISSCKIIQFAIYIYSRVENIFFSVVQNILHVLVYLIWNFSTLSIFA